ncbi:MAG: acyl-ACP--UDP-N-acetylglucosamine O-acyltransferase [Calditrichia bacterium]
MKDIHPTAIVSPKAELGDNVTIGPFCIVEDDVVLGDGCELQAHVIVKDGARLANNVKVAHGAVLASPPQDLKFKGEKTYLEIGENTVIREFATLNRGTDYHWKTEVGKNCFIMSYVHLAHDCIIGDNVIIANGVQMAGHVEVEDNVGIGGLTAIHQFVKIGRHSFVGGGLKINKDVPPFIRAMGDPVRYGGTNFVGLARKGFTKEDIAAIKQAYKMIYHSKMTIKEAISKLKQMENQLPVVQDIVKFVEKSERGLIKG